MEKRTWNSDVLRKKKQTENISQGDFPQSFYHLFIMQTEVCTFVDEETNGSNLLANRLNGLAHICL
jgi:hypothetical protein